MRGCMKPVVVIVLGAALLNACASDAKNDDPKSTADSGTAGKGTADSGTVDSGSDSGGDGVCSGEITGCAIGTLSSEQWSEACVLLTAAFKNAPGTKFECVAGPNKGLGLVVQTMDQCVANMPVAGCTLELSQLIDCYKAVEVSVCGSFNEGGACTVLFEHRANCGG